MAKPEESESTRELQPLQDGHEKSGPPRSYPTPKSLRERLKVDPKLFPVKLLVFLVYGGSAAMHPYVTVHMKSLGISVTEIAVIMLLVPILSSIGPSLAGMLADKLGNYKMVIIGFTFASVLFHASMWFFVPAYGVQTGAALLQNHNFTVHVPCDTRPVYVDPLPDNTTLVESLTNGTQWNLPLDDCVPFCPDSAESVQFVCFTQDPVHQTSCFPLKSRHTLALVDSLAKKFKVIDAEYKTAFQEAKDAGPDLSAPSTLTACLLGQEREWKNQTAQCELRCISEITVSNGKFEQIPYGDRILTVTLYLIFRFLSLTAFRGINPILDSAVLEYSKQHNADFGIQRLFASVGSVVIPPLSGWLTVVASKNCGCSDYGPGFYLFAGMNILAVLLLLKMDIRVKQPQTHLLRTMGIVLRNPNVVVFLVVVFFSGVGWGIILSYMFLFMEDDRDFQFSAPAWMLGLVNTVGYALGIPVLFFSTQLIKIFGHENLLAAGLLCYAGRFFAYSFTYNPWLIYPTEILTAVTFLVFVLAPQYAMKTAPKYLATLMGLFGAANFGLGGGIGPLIGGVLIHWLGYRPAFRILAGGFAVVGAVYLVVYHFVLKRRWQTVQDKTPPEKPAEPMIRPLTAVETGILSASAMSLTAIGLSDMSTPETTEFRTLEQEHSEITSPSDDFASGAGDLE